MSLPVWSHVLSRGMMSLPVWSHVSCLGSACLGKSTCLGKSASTGICRGGGGILPPEGVDTIQY